MSNPLTQQLTDIFLNDVPMIDLRAPCEFELGAFPTATNLPLMNDRERQLVGICYKTKGQQQAIELGHQLVSGETKQSRIHYWQSFSNQNNNAVFYCFRGGLRSRISQSWLSEEGIDLPIVSGGYKAMRRFLIDQTDRLVAQAKVYVLTGFTGSAKTKVIKNLPLTIDLEGIANHRGSSFGRKLTQQPSQIDFENQLGVKLLKRSHLSESPLILEDESRLIGARSIPIVLKNKMDEAPLIFLDQPVEYRIEQIYQDYVVELFSDFTDQYRENAIAEYHLFLVNACKKIAKRLGGQDLKRVLGMIGKAIEHQLNNDELTLHQEWIVFLLKNYYDPMYSFQISKKQNRVIFRGNQQEVSSYLSQLSTS